MANKTIDTKAFLCRGIRQDTGKWVEGYYICLHSDTDMHIIVDAVDGQYHQVIPETVGRYTGFTDETGKKIFEGDIVWYDHENERGTIKWDNGTARFITSFATFVIDFDSVYGDELEVIGNIYDNPELLEEE